VQVHTVTWNLDPCQGEVVLFNLGFVVSETDALRAIDNADDNIVLSWDIAIPRHLICVEEELWHFSFRPGDVDGGVFAAMYVSTFLLHVGT
jgi:hypothetical protein